MTDNFEEAERSLRRILESTGGSANAYDDLPKPTPAAKKEQPSRILEDDFEVAAASLERILRAGTKSPNLSPKSSVHSEPSGYGLELDEGPTSEDEAAFAQAHGLELAKDECATPLADLDPNVPATNLEEQLAAIPRPISPDYRYGGPVDLAGNLFGIYNDFKDMSDGRPSQGAIFSSPEGELRLDDAAKGIRYETSRTQKGLFIWVYHLIGPHADPIGYVQDGFVFLRR